MSQCKKCKESAISSVLDSHMTDIFILISDFFIFLLVDYVLLVYLWNILQLKSLDAAYV